MLLTSGVGEDSWESLGLKEIQPVHPKGDQSWVLIGRTDVEAETPTTLATWCEELTHWERPWFWERLRAGGEGDDQGWDCWMILPNDTYEFTPGRTGKPGVLQFMVSQRVTRDWATEQQRFWTTSGRKPVLLGVLKLNYFNWWRWSRTTFKVKQY